MSGNYTIYHGHVWTDHTDGRQILTLAPKPALALVSAIPLFISLVGTTLWSVVKRLWYHLRLLYLGKSRLVQPFKLQQQALLRNSSGDLAMSWTALGMYRDWSPGGRWRRCCKPSKAWKSWQMVSLVVVGVAYWAAWQAAGICSFYISQNAITDLVLIRGTKCGFLDLGSGNDTGTALATAHFRSTVLSQTLLAESWVSQCYGNSSGDSAACSLYPQARLSFRAEPDVGCPFASPKVCQNTTKNSSPHRMDSDAIDSHLHLGINALPAHRVTYRKVTTCSPIEALPFVQEVNANETDEANLWLNGTILVRFFFGPVTDIDEPWTYEYNKFAALDRMGYQIESLGYFPVPEGDRSPNAWSPNSNFSTVDDGDVSLFFLASNDISYVNETFDPMFSATDPHPVGGTTYYLGTYDVTVLGCVDQHQICNPNRDNVTGCTAPQGCLQLGASIFDIGLDKKQTAAAQRIVGTLELGSTLNSVNGRNEAALLASHTVSELIQELPLPVDQWRAEVENWYAVSLAKLQRNIIDFAGGPSDPAAAEWGTYPIDSDELSQTCYSQFVKMPAGYQNFNFDAIIKITVLGTVLIIVGLSFEVLFGACLKRMDKEDLEKSWADDDPFELQRLAYPHLQFRPLRSLPPGPQPPPSTAALQAAIPPSPAPPTAPVPPVVLAVPVVLVPPAPPAPQAFSFTSSSQPAAQTSSTALASEYNIELQLLNQPSSIHSTPSSNAPLLTAGQLLSIPPNGSNTSQSTSNPTPTATTSNASLGSSSSTETISLDTTNLL